MHGVADGGAVHEPAGSAEVLPVEQCIAGTGHEHHHARTGAFWVDLMIAQNAREHLLGVIPVSVQVGKSDV